MESKIKRILLELGFEEREIKIYLSLIKNNNSTALQISKDSRIDRTTVYDLLEKLIGKGLVSLFIENKAKHFSAISPEELLRYFKEKYYSLELILPEIKKLQKENKQEVSCELFSGKEGLKSVLKDFINEKKNYKVIGIRQEYEDFLEYLADQGVLKMNTFKVKEKAIVEQGVKFTKLKNGEYRYLDKKLIPPVTTLIYENKVIFFVWQEPYFAIKIKNKEIAKTQEEYFDLLWEIAKK